MKQILIVLTLFVLMVGTAFAAGNNNGITNQIKQEVQEQSSVKGLENAMLNVQNQERVRHLERVLNKIQERRMERLNQLNNLEITESDEGNITATGKGDAYFLGVFKYQKTFRYTISSEGDLVYIRGPFDDLIKFEE